MQDLLYVNDGLGKVQQVCLGFAVGVDAGTGRHTRIIFFAEG